MSTNAIEQRVIEMLDETGTDLSDEMKQRAVAVMVESVVEYSHQLLEQLLADTGSLTEELMEVKDQQDQIVDGQVRPGEIVDVSPRRRVLVVGDGIALGKCRVRLGHKTPHEVRTSWSPNRGKLTPHTVVRLLLGPGRPEG